MGSKSSEQPLHDNALEKLCHQVRVYNEDIYQIEGMESRREKCLANSMVVMSSQAGELEEHQRKKIRSLLNPVSYNAELNVEYAQLPKKQAMTNLQVSKMTSTTHQATSN